MAAIVGGLFGLICSFVVGIALHSTTGGAIRARSLTIENEGGNGAILLGVEDDGTAAISLHGRKDRKCALLASSPDGAALLTIYDGNGEQRAHVGVVENVTVMILRDEQSHPRTILNVEPDGEARLRFVGAQGEEIDRLPPEEK